MYNFINGYDPMTIFLMPMLSNEHPDEWPRFRDCWAEDGKICVYTRTGGNNRGYYGDEQLNKHPNFIETFDDPDDSTYAFFFFSVPKRWQKDYELIISGKAKDISEELQQQIDKVFPLLNGKLFWHENFGEKN